MIRLEVESELILMTREELEGDSEQPGELT